MQAPRKNCISWDDYFMALALLSGMRSKDPSTQVGAVLVNPENRIVGIGYNGLPRGCCDDNFPWDRQGPLFETKYAYVCHAEQNAIMNSGGQIAGCRLYVTLFPCNECAKLVLQARVSEIIYLSDKYHDTDVCRAARRMFSAAGVPTRKFVPDLTAITAGLGSNAE